jgi:glycerol-3-phosphate cytidylyltransferase|tara:strand:- start:404 stop:1768 length:1365 start_codon:yes stop_codon:yes gene_type:complete
MNILVLGAGTFGTAIANELSVNTDNDVVLFSRNQSKVEEINTCNTNKSCFPNKHLTKFLTATSDRNVFRNIDVIFIALPSSVILENLSNLQSYFKKDVLLVNLSKGLFANGVTIVESIQKELGINNIVTLKGPSFAVEVIEHAETLLTLGYSTNLQYEMINSIIKDTSLHIDCTTDIRGVEVLSVLKNIYALVLGVVDAKYNSPNTRFMILTKAFAETRILLRSLGGADDTLFLACGFGDLCMTSLNDLSRNRTLGLLIGKGFFSADYKSNSVILEGLNAVNLVHSFPLEHVKDNLPLLNKLHSFFDSKESNLSIAFDELVDRKFKTVLTYGTFDLLHYGHLEILRRASLLGDKLIVGISTDEFNELKGKTCILPYEKRKELLESLDYVDKVIPEDNWEQKVSDVQENDVDIFVMGNDWEGKFDELKAFCKVIYFPRTKGISTTKLKSILKEEE